MNYKITIQYDGSRYKGWQSQKDTEGTIQGKLAAILEQLAGEPVDVQGSGRTDAGVHARAQVASFSLTHPYTPKEVMDYLNRYLPEDIGVIEAVEAAPRFHARLNAQSKTYVYRIFNSSLPNVFLRKWMYTIEEPLDIEAMKHAAQYFLGTHDFAAFCASKTKKKSTVRTIYTVDVEQIKNEVRIAVTGNGFLHHMVRILVGTLVEVGLGKRRPTEMPELIEGKTREKAGVTMPAKGLILWQVDYPVEKDSKLHGKMDGNGQEG